MYEMVKEHGGHSIAVYSNNNKKATAKQLIRDNRVNFICQADYREGKEMQMIVRRILDKVKGLLWCLLVFIKRGTENT